MFGRGGVPWTHYTSPLGGGKGEAAEAAALRQLHRGTGAERGTILVLSTDLISPPPPGASTESDRNFQF